METAVELTLQSANTSRPDTPPGIFRILYISYDGLTDPLGQSQVLPYLKGLAGKGYQITILSFEKKQRFKMESGLIKEQISGLPIVWFPVSFTSRPPILSKLYDRLRMRRNAYKLYRKYRFHLVHCRSYLAAEAGFWLKRKTGIKFLFDMRGFWVEERVDNGQWNLRNPFFRSLFKYYKNLEKKMLLNADGIISLTQAGKNELLKKPGYAHLKIDVIPCCADLEHFDYRKLSQSRLTDLRKSLGLKNGEKVLTYQGSVGGGYMTMEMFDFFKRLYASYPEYRMMILTKDEPSRVVSEAVSKNIPVEKLIVKYVPRNQMPLYLGLTDCSIFFIRPTYSKIASSPTKHGELMGMGIPVICNEIGDTGNIIETTQTGHVIHEMSTEEYDGAIDRMSEVVSIQKEHIRKAALCYFDLDQGISDYYSIYKRLLKEDRQ